MASDNEHVTDDDLVVTGDSSAEDIAATQPVIRPALVEPNPDPEAPPTTPVYVTEEEAESVDPVPTSVLNPTATIDTVDTDGPDAAPSTDTAVTPATDQYHTVANEPILETSTLQPSHPVEDEDGDSADGEADTGTASQSSPTQPGAADATDTTPGPVTKTLPEPLTEGDGDAPGGSVTDTDTGDTGGAATPAAPAPETTPTTTPQKTGFPRGAKSKSTAQQRRKFPGISPRWGARPQTRQQDTAAADGTAAAEPSTRHSYSESVPTQAIRLNDRLYDSPYQVSDRQRRRGFEYRKAAEDSDVRYTLQFALRLGETLFRFGAGALEVETSIIVVTQAYGIPDAEIDITNQSISLNYVPQQGTPYTYQRVVRSWSSSYSGLAALHQLVSYIAQGDMPRDDAIARLAEIRHNTKTYPTWFTYLAGGLFSACFVLYIGGTLPAALLSIISNVIATGVIAIVARFRFPEVFGVMAGSGAATAFALTLFGLDIFDQPSTVVAGALMLILPALRIVTAVQDGINGFPITASGRIVSAALTYVGLVSGILIAAAVATAIGVGQIDLTRTPTNEYPLPFVCLMVFGAACFAALNEQAPWRFVIPTGLVSVIGYFSYVLAESWNLGNALTPGLAAVVVGFISRIVALRFGAPQLVVAIPGILFLLPGLMIFRSMYSIAVAPDFLVEALVQSFHALVIIAAMAFGSVLGDSLGRPFTGRMRANERRLIGRR